jgi:predicted peptidase
MIPVLVLAITPADRPRAPKNIGDGFVARVYRNGSETKLTMPYRLFIPNGYDTQKKYPLILWLHGGGAKGHDNLSQILGDQIPGTRTWTKPDNQAKYPAFVLAPQSAAGWVAVGRLGGNALSVPLVLVVEILGSLKNKFSIDSQRIYVAGQSDGGYGTWCLITHRPDLFAAAIPLCGGGDPGFAARAAKVPIWAFHGDADKVFPVTASREMIAAIKSAGGNPRYTEYKGEGHAIWKRTFAQQELVEWLFAQHK